MVLFVTPLLFPTHNVPINWEQVVNKVQHSTVFIVSETSNDNQNKIQKSWSKGSGFIISSDGYIVTNQHMTGGTTSVQITLDGNQWYPVKIVGSDEKTDISLLKLDAKNLIPVKIGSTPKQGEAVLAWGNPFGFYNTVSSGIVSNTRQYMPDDPYYKIQTDAAINHGNSGGPLLNSRGEVVGMNQAIYSPTEGNAGIAFAIPIEQVMDIAKRLQTKGEISRGFLGITYFPLNTKLSNDLKVPDSMDGLIVAVVQKGSPAEKAGINQGDLILMFDGVPTITDNYKAFSRAVLDHEPGYPMNLKIIRLGKTLDVVVTLGKWTNTIPAADVPKIGPKDKK